jgi:hypothetical protein
MGDVKITGPAAQQLAALPKYSAPSVLPPDLHPSNHHTAIKVAGAVVFAGAVGSLAAKNHVPFLKAHLDHGPLKWAAWGVAALGALGLVAGCSSGSKETLPEGPPITPAELNQNDSIVKSVLTVGTFQHERGFVADDQTKFTGQNSTSSSESATTSEHHIRNFLPDSMVLGGMQDSSSSITTMGTDATSGHFDHTKVVDPLKTVGQLGMPDGYASADDAIEDVFGRPGALNGFVVVKDGDAYKAEAFAVPPTGVEWIKPTPNVAAVVIGTSVLTPQKVNGELQMQDNGQVQTRTDTSGIPADPRNGLVDNTNGTIDLGKVDPRNPSAGFATSQEAIGAALQINGLQAVVQNSISKRFFLVDEKTDYPLASKYFNGEGVPAKGLDEMETVGGYMVPSSANRWRDPTTFNK